MVKCICTNKVRDFKGRITGYFLDDGVNRKIVKQAELKEAIASKKINCINLQIDKLGRLVDKAESKDSTIKNKSMDQYAAYILKMRPSLNKDRVLQLDTNARKLAATCIKEYNECLNSILNILSRDEVVTYYTKYDVGCWCNLTDEEKKHYNEDEVTSEDEMMILSSDVYISCVDKKKVEVLLNNLKELGKYILINLPTSVDEIYDRLMKEVIYKARQGKYQLFGLNFTYGNCDNVTEMDVVSQSYNGVRLMICFDRNKLGFNKESLKHIKENMNLNIDDSIKDFINKTCHFGTFKENDNYMNDIFGFVSDSSLGKLVVDTNGIHIVYE